MSRIKVTGVYSIEAGCLGPDGADFVEDFCSFGEGALSSELDSAYISWIIVPRYDKNVPEIQYKLNDKLLSHSMASRYFAALGEDLDKYEEDFHRVVEKLIDQYAGF